MSSLRFLRRLRPLRTLVAASALLLGGTAQANDIDNQVGWVSWFHNHKLNDQWRFISDVQFRSDDNYSDLDTLLIRPGLSYQITPEWSAGGGYLYVRTFDVGNRDLVEHRPWQQLVYQKKFGDTPVQQRFRLEQRFIERASGDDIFSQRFRYFVRALVPIGTAKTGSQSAFYIPIQNELFLHLSNKDQLNGETFDQNRAFIGVGYRPTPQIDVEVNYLNQRLNRARNVDNHVIQLAVFTRF
jgi:hypothetical protein